MGLRDRYVSALVARCAVAVPRGCNTQRPVKVLRVAPPTEMEHAINDQAVATAVTVTRLDATVDATITQHAQRHDDEAKVERCAFVTADRMLLRTDAEILTFEKRVARSIWLGYSEPAGRAERLLHRDRDADDRRLCVECQHAGPAWRCAKREAFLPDQLQRCPVFKEETP
jgi:hypothetical protein